MSYFNSMTRNGSRHDGGGSALTLNDMFRTGASQVATPKPIQSGTPAPAPPASSGATSSADDKFLIRPLSARQVEAEEMEKASLFKDKNSGEVDDTHAYIEYALNAGIAILGIIGIANGWMKIGTVQLVTDPYANGLAMAGVIGGLVIGPIILFFLKKGMKIGAFSGLSLVFAWITIAVILADETGSLLSMFDHSFTETYFHFAAFTIPAILTLTFMVILLKPDVRRARELNRLNEQERHNKAKGAIKERMQKERAETNARRMRNLANKMANIKYTIIAAVTAVVRGWKKIFSASLKGALQEADAVYTAVVPDTDGVKKAPAAPAKKAKRRWFRK